MSNKLLKAEKRERQRRESGKKRRIRSIALILIGLIALAFDAALARKAIEQYKGNENLQYGRLGAFASVSPYVLLVFIIVLTICLLMKQNKKK